MGLFCKSINLKKIIILLLIFCSVCEIHSQEFKAKITYQATLNNEDFYVRLVKDTTLTKLARDTQIDDISFIYLYQGVKACTRPNMICLQKGAWDTNPTEQGE